jgi:CBS domain-containing protein
MNNEGLTENRQINFPIYYSELIAKKITRNGEKIGILEDLVIMETPGCPEVKYFHVRCFPGRSSLMIPWDKVLGIHGSSIEITPDSLPEFEREPGPGDIRLREYILEKKVIDLDDHEIKVVYDLHLIINMFNKLLVFEVDFSRISLLRRYGFFWLSRFLQGGGKAEAQTTPWMYVQMIPDGTGEADDVSIKTLKENLSRMHPVDIAEIIEDMDQDQRAMVFSELDTSTASDALEEIAPPIQREIVSVLTREKAVAIINEMTPGQAADILSTLPYEEATEILKVMTPEKVQKVRSILERSGENILNYTTTRFIMLPPDARVGEVRDDYARLARDKDVIMYLYIVDDSDILRGVVDIKELLQADDNQNLLDIMVYEMITLTSRSTLKEAAEEFSRYDFRALPVVDDDEKIIGVVPYRDIVKLRRHTPE